jgi:hypothetical protein
LRFGAGMQMSKFEQTVLAFFLMPIVLGGLLVAFA